MGQKMYEMVRKPYESTSIIKRQQLGNAGTIVLIRISTETKVFTRKIRLL